MKKTLLLSIIFCALFSTLKTVNANAQITGVSAIYTVDSFYSSVCSLPADVPLMLYGSVTGTVTPTDDTVTIYINFGDGFDSTFQSIIYSSGASGGSYSIFADHIYSLPGTYAPYVTVTAIGGATNTTSATPVVVSDACATLQGVIYVDANSNCTHDSGEVGVAYLPIWVVNTTVGDTFLGGWTNDTGYYSINLPADDYNIIANNSYLGWYWWGGYGSTLAPSCPSSGMYTLTATSSSSYTENFAFSCASPDTFDMRADGWNWELVRGDTTYIDVWAGNWWYSSDIACTSLSSTVTLTLDPHLHYVGYDSLYAYGPAPTVSGSTLTWNIGTSSDLFYFVEDIRVYVDTLTSFGDTLCNSIYATPTSLIDPDLANNTSYFCGPVLASWDPNGIAVSPKGAGVPGYIANKTGLSYEIHFQNTGSAPASNITVNDTLSDNVDITTLHVLNATAPVEILVSGNIVKFRFSDINLPDSAANPTSSIGSVTFGVLPKQGLAQGTQIFNNASIYFDYNPAVITNTVLNTIDTNVSEGVQHISKAITKATIYPNPAGDEVYAMTNDRSDFTITMSDMLGRIVKVGKSVSGNVTLNTQNLPTGVYLVQLTNTNGKQLTNKLTIQH